MKKLLRKITRPYRRIRARIAYDRAVRMAEEALTNTCQRTYVIKSRGKDGKKQFLLVDRKNFRRFKQLGYINPKATIKSLEQYCFYCTSYINGKDAMPPQVVKSKRQRAIIWHSN